jgi:predicted HD phosphohydrolase
MVYRKDRCVWGTDLTDEETAARARLLSNTIHKPVDEVFEAFEQRGGADYGGERVSQLEHALQCAALAEEAGADAALISAALLHDIGHLVHELGREPATRGIDDRHELRGREWLSRRFGEDVTEPVRQHVDAKRYLTATDPGYFSTL